MVIGGGCGTQLADCFGRIVTSWRQTVSSGMLWRLQYDAQYGTPNQGVALGNPIEGPRRHKGHLRPPPRPPADAITSKTSKGSESSSGARSGGPRAARSLELFDIVGFSCVELFDTVQFRVKGWQSSVRDPQTCQLQRTPNRLQRMQRFGLADTARMPSIQGLGRLQYYCSSCALCLTTYCALHHLAACFCHQ